MKHRSPLAVFFLSLFTLGIYSLVWQVKTKGELTRLGADIPTSWLIIVPFANLYWVWKYCAGVEKVSGGKISAVMALILMLLLSLVGYAILQSMYNDLPTAAAPAVSTAPGQPPTPTRGPLADPMPQTNPMPGQPNGPQPPLPPTLPSA